MNIAAPPVSGEAARFALRRETRDDHAILDSHPAFAAMADDTLTIGQYCRLMEALAAVYRCLDPRISEACLRLGVGAYGFAYALRAPMLEGDCAALGIDGKSERTTDEPGLNLTSAAALAGALYVIEGSVLGGAMLHRSTLRFRGPKGEVANGYWAWCATAGKARWASACRLIEAVDTDAVARIEMREAAQSVFRAIAEALEPLALEMDPDRHKAC